jgi:gliding motility-associated-like protein
MKTFKSLQAKNFSAKVITALFALLFVSPSFSQEANDYTVNYRVTAYKNGNPAITSVSNTAEIIPDLLIYVPNSFTPNDDGLNDKFGAVGEGIIEYNMQIFNVWGNLVFESKNPSTQWDGKHNGLLCAEGAYTYLISAKSEKRRLKKSGSINLIM